MCYYYSSACRARMEEKQNQKQKMGIGVSFMCKQVYSCQTRADQGGSMRMMVRIRLEIFLSLPFPFQLVRYPGRGIL